MYEAPAHKEQARPGSPLAQMSSHEAWLHPLQGWFGVEHCSPSLWTSFFCTCPIQVLSHQLGARVLLLHLLSKIREAFRCYFILYICVKGFFL